MVESTESNKFEFNVNLDDSIAYNETFKPMNEGISVRNPQKNAEGVVYYTVQSYDSSGAFTC